MDRVDEFGKTLLKQNQGRHTQISDF